MVRRVDIPIQLWCCFFVVCPVWIYFSFKYNRQLSCLIHLEKKRWASFGDGEDWSLDAWPLSHRGAISCVLLDQQACYWWMRNGQCWPRIMHAILFILLHTSRPTGRPPARPKIRWLDELITFDVHSHECDQQQSFSKRGGIGCMRAQWTWDLGLGRAKLRHAHDQYVVRICQYGAASNLSSAFEFEKKKP